MEIDTDVLIYQNNANVFPSRELVECRFDRGCFGFAINDEEVLLSIGTCCHMLQGAGVSMEHLPSKSSTWNLHRCLPEAVP